MGDVLGYQSFTAAGGDMGAGVSIELARLFPDAVQAIHLTDVGYPTGQEDSSSFSAAERDFASFVERWWMSEGAYAMLQSTKPNTLGFALNDSPVGLAAWIAEKYRTWRGGDENAVTPDDLLTNIMMYWLTGTAASVRAACTRRMYAKSTWVRLTRRPAN
jgi:microsomal epoxide hydrolase